MSSRLNIEVQGFPELLKKIEALENDKQKKTEIVGILKQVAGSTVTAAKRYAPVSKKKHKARGKVITPGNLKKSIGTIVGKKGQAVENPTVYAGPRAKGNFNGWYGHFVEQDRNIYRKGFKRKRNGDRTGNASGAAKVVKGQFFMKKAYDQTKGKVTAESEKKVARYIQRRIDRLSQ